MVWCQHHAVSGRWSDSHPQILGQEGAKLGCITFLSAGVTRRPIMIQTWLGTPRRAPLKCQSLAGLPWTPPCGLGLLFLPSPGRRVVLLGLDIGHTDISMHLSSVTKQRATGHRVTWLMTGDHHALAMRGWYHLGIVGNLMARSILSVRMSLRCFSISGL